MSCELRSNRYFVVHVIKLMHVIKQNQNRKSAIKIITKKKK